MWQRMLRPATAGPSFYLDSLSPAPRAVLSLRKLISSASQCARVRRSSDNAEQDIGFSDGALDVAALLSFVGSGSAFVTTLYDQTGNGEHLVQATAASQPRIVNAGVYDGKLVFDGTDDAMRIQALTLGAPQVGLYFRLALPGTYTTYNMLYELTPEFVSNGPHTFASYHEDGLWTVQSQSTTVPGGVRSHRYDPAPWAAMGLRTFLYDASTIGSDQIRAWNNGGFLEPGILTSTNQSGNYKTGADLFIGSRADTTFFTSLWLHTLVIYSADSDAIRTKAESIISA